MPSRTITAVRNEVLAISLVCCMYSPVMTLIPPLVGPVCATALPTRTPRPNFPSKMNFQALARFFAGGDNWGGDRQDWTVPLGPFAEGRPRLAPGRRGEFIPVFDDQPTTIIAYRCV